MTKSLLPKALLKEVAARFRLLGDPVRLELLNLMQQHHELSVGELVEATGYKQANISKHLGLLCDAGMIGRRKEGTYVYYSITDPSLSGLCLLVCGQLAEQ